MKVNKFNKNLIKKIDFSFEDMNDYEDWHKCANIVHDNKQTNIEYNDMFAEFGESNFMEDYDDSDWWILEYNDDKFAVDISSHGEGSWIEIYLPDQVGAIYDDNIKQKVKIFFNQLYKQIKK